MTGDGEVDMPYKHEFMKRAYGVSGRDIFVQTGAG